MPLEVNSIPHQLERFGFFLDSSNPNVRFQPRPWKQQIQIAERKKKRKEKTFPKSSASLSTRINFPCHMPAAALPHVGGELVFVPRSLECVAAKQGQIR